MSLIKGKKITFLKDNEDPSVSANTDLVACALSCGIPFASDSAFTDVVERVDGKPKRTVSWIMDADAQAEFELPNGTIERLTFNEIRKRVLDEEWLVANDTHPLTYAWAPLRQRRSLVGKIKTMKPMALIRKGKSFVTIPADATDAQRHELLQLL